MSVKAIERTASRKVHDCLGRLEKGMRQKTGGLGSLLSPETRARHAAKDLNRAPTAHYLYGNRSVSSRDKHSAKP